ncbi:hypothetical protein [Pedobacter rhizosphaerae]|uniref:DUF5018 domain-containing protein n=1 Tax=Pedobacter rhizosphaerae TaxID=390241 RepID=A0A1H9UR05_9SPHI|nr:hypothetical protein [Pedobacter rhizosphaerae]SES11788.1 hypothetical protein SAMN04488023_13313 [Pedobacter rhizosphaerae]
MKNNYLFAGRTIALLMLFMSLLVFQACKKEYTDYPYNTIENFNITTTDGSKIEASIVGQDIIVYWPPFQDVPASITPNIIVSERASISPASGTAVPFKTGKAYQVTAEDGSIKKYQIKAIVNQPDLGTFNVVNETSVVNDATLIRYGTSILLNSKGYIYTDTAKTHLYMVTNDGKQTQLKVEITSNNGETLIKAVDPLIEEKWPASTKFKLKLVSGYRTATSTETYTVAPLAPVMSAAFFTAKTVKRGDSFTITGVVDASYFTSAGLSTAFAGTYYPLIISAKTGNSITFTIPADFPLGTYFYFNYSFNSGPYHNAAIDQVALITSSSRRITITE